MKFIQVIHHFQGLVILKNKTTIDINIQSKILKTMTANGTNDIKRPDSSSST